MTDEAKALVAPDKIELARIIRRAGHVVTAAEVEALTDLMQLIETQAREIERLKDAAIDAHDALVSAKAFIFKHHGTQNEARNEAIAKLRGILGEPSAALAGESHD